MAQLQMVAVETKIDVKGIGFLRGAKVPLGDEMIAGRRGRQLNHALKMPATTQPAGLLFIYIRHHLTRMVWGSMSSTRTTSLS